MARPGSKPIDELIRLAMIGDGSAFTELWDTHIDALRAYLRSTMKQLDTFYVDDVCSKSFEKAFRQISSYDKSKSQFSTWLRTIAHNTALDLIDQEERVQRKYIYIDDDSRPSGEIVNTIRDEIDTPLDSIIKTEDQQQTERYIDALPELYRAVARKRMIDGLQYKEISEELEMELNTVRTRIRRAKALIEKMKTDDERK